MGTRSQPIGWDIERATNGSLSAVYQLALKAGGTAVRAMTSRSIITVSLAVLCGAALWGILAQGRQVSELRAEEQRLESTRPTTNDSAADTIASPTPEVPRELLQLRAEVARLSQQQRELSGARKENEKLRLQLENRRTNSASLKAASAGYIRTSDAKWVGCNTPQDTLQSAFWAMRNHELEKYLDTLEPGVAEANREGLRTEPRSADDFFKGKVIPPLFRIKGVQQINEGLVEVQVEISPDISPISFALRQVDGQWKLVSPL